LETKYNNIPFITLVTLTLPYKECRYIPSGTF